MRLIRKLGRQLREYTVPVVVALRAALLSTASTTSPRLYPSLAARLYAVVTITVNHLRPSPSSSPFARPDVTSQSPRCNDRRCYSPRHVVSLLATFQPEDRGGDEKEKKIGKKGMAGFMYRGRKEKSAVDRRNVSRIATRERIRVRSTAARQSCDDPVT